MFQLQSNSWEKLREQLHAEAFCSSNSLIDILFEINSLVGAKHSPGKTLFARLQSNILNEVNELNEDDKLKSFAKVFCNHLSVKKKTSVPSEFLISSALETTKISSVLACIIFRHIASELDLKIVALGIEDNCILKCLNEESHDYVDLSKKGKLLTSKELVSVFNDNKSCFKEGFPETIKNKDLFKIYLKQLFQSVCPNGNSQIQLIVLNILLEAFPGSLEHYGFRALLLAKLNRNEEALQDLGKYFSFVPQENASEELKDCYCNLRSLH